MQRTLSDISYSPEEIAIAAMAKALSHPVRIRILRLLAEQTCCFTGELTELIPMAQSTISQHLSQNQSIVLCGYHVISAPQSGQCGSLPGS